MGDIEVRRDRIIFFAKWGLVILGAALAAPIAYLAIKGIVGLAIAGALGAAVIGFARPFANLIATWRIKAIVAIAEANPIETMKDLRVQKEQELDQADRDIEAFEAEIGSFGDQLGDFKKQYPEEAERYDELNSTMKKALKDMREEQRSARAELERFKAAIKKAEAIYKMALAAARVTKLSKSAEARVFAQIREDASINAVRTTLNRAFAGLNTALERRAHIQSQQALPAAQPRETIEVQARDVTPVARKR